MLVAGDGRGAFDVLQRAISAGADVDEVYLEILSPVLKSIGERWSRGEIDISVEHLATSIATRLVGQLSPRFSRPGRRRGVLVIGGPTGERHGLVLAMLADLLRREGWDVLDLGADTPAQSFAHAAAGVEDLVAIGISVSSDESLDSARETLKILRTQVGDDVRLVIGGHAIRDLDHARSLGADHWANGAREFAEYLDLIRSSG
jgi:methanogenic corrinoid protein MtbC1